MSTTFPARSSCWLACDTRACIPSSSAGLKVRPPVWLRRVGLEWLYYLVRQPSRFGRMLSLPRFVLVVLRAGKSERKH